MGTLALPRPPTPQPPARAEGGLSPALLAALDQGCVSGFGFLAAMLAARLVGIDEFGRFALVLIFVAFAQGIHNALVTAPMMTLAGRRRRALAAYDGAVLAGAAIVAVLMAGSVAMLLGGLFAIRGEPIPVGIVAAASALTIAQNLQFTLRRMLFARGRGGAALVMDIARGGAFPLAVGGLWLIGAHLDAVALLWTLALTALGTTLPLAWPVWTGRGTGLRLSAVTRRHWAFARWLFPIVFVTFGQEQLAWILVSLVIGDEAIGGLRAAQYLVGLVLVLLAATENTLPTDAGRAYAESGTAGLTGYLLRATFALGTLVGALLLAVAVPAETWLRLVFGEPYAAYAGSVRILALGVFIVLLRDMAAHFFRAMQETRVIFRAAVAGCAASLAVLYPLLMHGVTGAALAIVVGHAASMVYLIVAAVRFHRRARAAPAGPAGATVPPC